jgi:hypothetical protein
MSSLSKGYGGESRAFQSTQFHALRNDDSLNQEGNQSELWRRLIMLQRRRIASMLVAAPALADTQWLQDAWLDAAQSHRRGELF